MDKRSASDIPARTLELPVAVFTVAADGRVVDVNDRVAALFGIVDDLAEVIRQARRRSRPWAARPPRSSGSTTTKAMSFAN